MLAVLGTNRPYKNINSKIRLDYVITWNVINAKKSKLGRDFLKELDIAIRSHFLYDEK